MSDDTRLTFKQMCAEFDVTPRTLRYYEYIELLTPEREGRARFYTARERARMTLIMRGRSFGFPLEGIRRWLKIYEDEGSEIQMQIWIRDANNQLKELDEKREQLDKAYNELVRLRDATLESLAGEATESDPARVMRK